MKSLNSRGFTHFAALAIVVLAVAIAGTYHAVASHALVPSDNGSSNMTAAVATCRANRPTLSNGQTGDCVKYLQNKLGVKPADGIFGQATKAKVNDVQRRNHLQQDGIVGPCTWAQILDGKTTAACKVSTVASHDVVKPTPVDIAKVYCTYHDVDHTLLKKIPMTRSECKAHHGAASTTPPQVSCTYIDSHGKKFTAMADNDKACETRKNYSALGTCTRPSFPDEKTLKIVCDHADPKNVLKQPGTWKALPA